MRRYPNLGGWAGLRYLCAVWFPLTLIAWTVLVVGVGVVGISIGVLGDLQGSVWEYTTQIPRWYALVVGVTLVLSALPLHVTHGRTRREFALQAGVFGLALSTLLATLITLGFALELLVRDATGLGYELGQDHLFSTPDQFGLVFAEHWLLCAAWTATGALVSAAFSRLDWLPALATLPVGLLMIGAAESTNEGYLRPLRELGVALPQISSFPLTLLLCLATLLAGTALTWLLVRDAPVASGTT